MIPELSDLLNQSVAQTLEDRVAVSFSGGLDSTLIATVANKHANVDLFSCGFPDAEDMEYSEKVAKTLNLPLHKTILTEQSTVETYNICKSLIPEDFLIVEILVPVYKMAEAAKAANHEVILFGCGAEELFVGYERYYISKEEGADLQQILRKEFKNLRNREISWINKICRKFNLEARYPFYNSELEKLVRSIPLEELMDDREKKKPILREAGKLLGVPELALQRKKKAMQYGSGVHKLLYRYIKSGKIS